MKHDLLGQADFRGEPAQRVRPLVRDDLRRLRLGWSSRFDEGTVARLLSAHPGLSVWLPATGEYVLAGPWRHRAEIVSILELGAGIGAVALMRGLAEVSAAAGKRLIIASERHESRRREFYDRVGFTLLEEIVIYDLSRGPHRAPALMELRFERVDLAQPEARRELIAVDRRAFPWLWWNSEEEFDNYAATPGVALYLGRDPSGAAVSYVGVTNFRSWGHLDRIAVVPEAQGRGYGRQSLDWAVLVLAEGGARRIGLSTQSRNERSRRLYDRYGFQRVESQDYALYGRWLGPAEPTDE